MPGEQVGEIAADRRADGRCERRHEPDNGCHDRLVVLGKTVKAAAKTVGIMPPPMKPCSARKRIISLIESTWAHMKLISREAAGGDGEDARVEKTRERKPESGIMTTSATR